MTGLTIHDSYVPSTGLKGFGGHCGENTINSPHLKHSKHFLAISFIISFGEWTVLKLHADKPNVVPERWII